LPSSTSARTISSRTPSLANDGLSAVIKLDEAFPVRFLVGHCSRPARNSMTRKLRGALR
jgi:hypothetical protein